MDHARRALLFPACSQFISNFKLFIIFPRQNSARCCCTLLANPCSRNRRFHSAQVRQISTKTRITPSRHPAHFCSPPAVLRTRNPARTYIDYIVIASPHPSTMRPNAGFGQLDSLVDDIQKKQSDYVKVRSRLECMSLAVLLKRPDFRLSCTCVLRPFTAAVSPK